MTVEPMIKRMIEKFEHRIEKDPEAKEKALEG